MKQFYFLLLVFVSIFHQPLSIQAQPCPVGSPVVTNETCAGLNNGTVTIPINSPGTYTYTWLPNVSTSNAASNLAPGNYSVTVTSGSGGPSGTPVNLFSNNFNGSLAAWTLNTGGGSNQWFIDNNYTGGTCYFSGFPIVSVPNVAAQPAAVTGNPYSNYLHIRATTLGFCDPPWPPLNANYDGDAPSTQCTEMALPISTTGYGNVTLSFYWLGVGSGGSYGYVQYSTGAGWTSVGGNFSGSSNWQLANLTNAGFDNQSSIRYRFCWTNNSTGSDPAFSVDEVNITGQTLVPGCTSVVSFTVQPGISVSGAFTTLNSTYCSGAPDVILVPTTPGGTFSGNGVSGNIFAPRDVTVFDTPISITYTVTQSGCTGTTTQNVIVYEQPDAAFTELNETYLTTDPPVILTPVVPGGTFSGPCMASNVFLPSFATPGVPCAINYTITVNGCTSVSTQSVLVNPPGASGTLCELKVILQGPYNSLLSNMSTTLRNTNRLPLTQPYNSAPWNYTGSENTPTYDAQPPTATDWVLIEARSAADPTQLLDRRAGFVLSNGVVVSTGGTNGITFGSITAGSYHIVVRHRNHLPIMSSIPVVLPNSGNPYDFTLSAAKTLGEGQTVQLNPNVWGMRAGDLNANGVITFTDYNLYQSQILSGMTMNGYFKPDLSLDGNVTVADFNLYQPNAATIGISIVRY